MNDEHSHEPEWPAPVIPDRDPALAALESAWRTGALVENEPSA